MSEHEHEHKHEEECCCEEHEHEHHHHHEHDEDCDCGCHEHEHEHHHHHEHDEDCDCGCHDHDHEHHHDHEHGEDCDCGCHDHEHEHEHHHDGISITFHDMSMIGSMAGTLNATYEEGEKILGAQLREIGRRVTEAGGIIGHIKFVLTSQGKSCQISVTDVDESVRYFSADNCHVEGVAIVFCLEEDTLREILHETLGSVLTVAEG